MEIILYNTKSNINSLNKNITEIEKIQGRITEPSDILKPVFIISTREMNFNYLYCANFKRFYFVNKIEVLDGTRISVYCDVDVLMSHKQDILKSNVIAERSTSNFNKQIPDNYDVVTSEKRFSFSRLPFNFSTKESDGSHYILTIGGK